MTETLAAGTAVERYVVEAPIGRGGMAVVYRVRHTRLGTHHAMKVLTIPLVSVRDRLLQEGRVQATLQHPNIVNVTDIVSVDGQPGLIMELIRGPALDRLLRESPPTLEQADILARGILEGVIAAHARGLVHRDLKPANVMLAIRGGDFVPKITDFGLAKLVGNDGQAASATRTGAMLGTPAYMSPEQVRDAKNVDERADVFALGAILYELVVGKPAFMRSDVFETVTAVATGDCLPIREARPDAPERMHRAIEGALKVNPGDRTASARRLLAEWLDREVEESSGAWSASLIAGLQAERGAEPGPEGGVETWNPDAGTAGTLLPGGAPTMDSATTLAPPDPVPLTRRSLLRWVPALGGFAALLLAVGVWRGFDRPPAPVAEEPPAPVAAEVEPAPALAPPPAPVTVAPEPTSAPVELSRPRPATPKRTATAAVAPEPEAVPDPAPTAPPIAEHEPEPEPPVVTGPAEGFARVDVTGDAKKVWLLSAEGNFALPADVRAGTYKVRVAFVGAEPSVVNEITLSSGESRTIRCSGTLGICR